MSDEKPKSKSRRDGCFIITATLGGGLSFLLFIVLLPVLVIVFLFTPLNRVFLPFIALDNAIDDALPSAEGQAAAYMDDLMAALENGEPLPDDLPPRMAEIERVGRAVPANNNMVGDAWVYVTLADGVQANVVFENNMGRRQRVYLREYEQPFAGFTDRGRANRGENRATIAVGTGDRWRVVPGTATAFSVQVLPANPATTREIMDLTANGELFLEMEITERGGERNRWYRDSRTNRDDLTIDRITVGPDTESFTIELRTMGNMLGGDYTLTIGEP